jgi:hypothetical protein
MQDIFKEFNRMILLDSNWLNSSNASLSDMAFQNRFIKYPWAPFSIQAPKDWWCPLKSWERNPIKHCVFIVPATKDEAYDAWQAQQDIIANQEGLGIIYTDGSKSEDGVGAASINMSSGERLQWNLPGYASVFQAEALGLEKAISLTPLAYRKLHIFTDSRSVLDGLRFYNNPEQYIIRVTNIDTDKVLDFNDYYFDYYEYISDYRDDNYLIISDNIKGNMFNYEFDIDGEFDIEKLRPVVLDLCEDLDIIVDFTYDSKSLIKEWGDYDSKGFYYYLCEKELDTE